MLAWTPPSLSLFQPLPVHATHSTLGMLGADCILHTPPLSPKPPILVGFEQGNAHGAVHGCTYWGGRSVSHTSWLEEHVMTLKLKKNEVLLISYKSETEVNARLVVLGMMLLFIAEGEGPKDSSTP